MTKATSRDNTEQLRSAALQLGFQLVGVASAESPKTFSAYQRWIDYGMHAGMSYLAEHCQARRDPSSVQPGVRSLLLLGVSYAQVLQSDSEPPHPVARLSGIAEYARGIDYHAWIRSRLKQLVRIHRELFPKGHARGVVDTAPILERQYAVEAGLGRIGKNTMLIHPQFGSKLFLAVLLSTEMLELDQPIPIKDDRFPCDSCQNCLQACPTAALVEPYVLDARRCLNYWTIEHRGEIPSEIRQKMGDRFFGCDLCQQVCPWNKTVPTIPGGREDPRTLDAEALEKYIVGTPLERTFSKHSESG